MFWHPQHLRNLPELADWARADRERLVTKAFFIVTFASLVSQVGNFRFALLYAALLLVPAALLALIAPELVEQGGAASHPLGPPLAARE